MATPNNISSLNKKIHAHELLSDSQVLCCHILRAMEQGLSKVNLKTTSSLWVRFLIFFLFTSFLSLILDISFNLISIQGMVTILSLAFISTIVLVVVKYLRDLLFPFLIALVVKKVINIKNKEEILHTWLERYANLKNQVVWSSSATIITNGLLLWAWLSFHIPLTPGIFLALIIVIFIGTQLPFWTYGIIHIFEILSRCNLRLYSLNPSQDETLIRLHNLAMFTLFLGSIIVVSFAVATYLAFFQTASIFLAKLIFIAWYSLGVLFAIALFVFPLVYTSRIILNKKRRFLADLQKKIERIYSEMKEIEPEKLAQIERAWSLYQLVERTPNSLLSWDAVRIFVGSIGIQSLPVISSLFDWKLVSEYLTRLFNK